MTIAKKATLIATLSAGVLTILKLAIGILSGSVAILASAVDSILDMFVSIFNMFAIHNSEKPADKNFNYGRGKIEALAAVIEGTIITISGFFILYQSVIKALKQEQITHMNESIIVMIISFVITFLLVIYLNYVAKKTSSMVIKSDALHYKTDLWSNGAVLLSLLIIHFSGWLLVDSIIGGIIAIYIIYSAYELISNGVLVLLDGALSDETVTQIEKIILKEESVSSFHFLKTREAGNQNFVDVHVVFHCLISLMEAHRSSDNIENQIINLNKNASWILNIHLDPYDDSNIQVPNCINTQQLEVKK